MEYSLGASILLHFLNNAFVEATGQLRNIYPYAGVFDSLFTYACTAAAIAIIVLNFKKIKEYIQREKAEKGESFVVVGRCSESDRLLFNKNGNERKRNITLTGNI